MTNPEIVRQPTPNGGDLSEMWLLDDNGNAVTDKASATQFRILEKTNGGEIVFETYGKIKGRGKQ